ncbi:hypothetical protein [Komagataeibacter xylinus]|uniref:Uncharacterized protein n=1 Tax=Komagataeibacter xylinus TaxID=28448 RepID=A0A857FSD1_KOMXY|nr:hypothetical protein [Komagataeibacter xylinus]QHC36439.1 hypothetical protein FMA36_13865 [Komagataeibacter xylinus]
MKGRLPSCYRRLTRLMLTSRRFSADTLLITADAYRELAASLTVSGDTEAARQAIALHDQLIAEAPRRVALPRPISFRPNHGKTHEHH